MIEKPDKSTFWLRLEYRNTGKVQIRIAKKMKYIDQEYGLVHSMKMFIIQNN